MRIRKVITALITSVLILTFAPSAFAQKGVADTFDTAIEVELGYVHEHGGYLDAPDDLDFYHVKNTTPGMRTVAALFTPPNSGGTYDLMFIVFKNDGQVISFKDEGNYGSPAIPRFLTTTINPGEDVYVLVRGRYPSDYDPNTPYRLVIDTRS
ncbi:hypothetical protein [Paenibacillus apiarius]|uniref:Uncharacterized protein n=1 Tax=Paenibacillus apiarius TaxID=46240 RepID=A0ABT4DNL5_9BACL|nr:hypothetical protein [Paenibacillus apiarius]MCY9517298.1 hypothetical protein [Paenibacillus apiarius]MCY9518831.1 hypothetical protein [Paenibacillus apiarius]MCY9552728.1 hypothetical protein [Paenibacillus apiarius]MCY9556753.1 hypothetical protein [Paenibacillus apiarius]MCY9684348.1 hypothetical protein [Paenibacillus apiarius]